MSYIPKCKIIYTVYEKDNLITWEGNFTKGSYDHNYDKRKLKAYLELVETSPPLIGAIDLVGANEFSSQIDDVNDNNLKCFLHFPHSHLL